uniref:Uncharacterized protein LOC111113667 n=1 Tax=Crassostrea virginica TaxID=6565 RepID=A0A8B8BXU4_CRAVI|nr:uncharacterized protein LOC111113667 [Crassostrea virginica]
MCQEPYKTWARENCAQYCGFCGTELECLYTPWADISLCTRTCGGGFKVQVRAFSFVPKGTELAKNCDKDLYRNKTCNLNACPLPKPSNVVNVPKNSFVNTTTMTPVYVDTENAIKDPRPADVYAINPSANLLTELLPVFAFSFLGKRDINDHKNNFEYIVKSILENQISN